jgi:hypothetical protein
MSSFVSAIALASGTDSMEFAFVGVLTSVPGARGLCALGQSHPNRVETAEAYVTSAEPARLSAS